MKRKHTIVIFFTISVLLIGIGTTFAFLKVVQEGAKRQVITASDLQVELEEGEELTIQDAMPMYDEVGKLQKAFEFKVINQSKYDVLYVLYLKDITDPSRKKLNYEDVKYYLTTEQEEIKLEKLSERVEDKIDEGTIAKKSEIHYSLRLWIDSEVVENEQIEGKTLSFRVTVEIQKDERERYNITYNTGTAEIIETMIKIEKEKATLSPVVPKRTNYTFLGWSTTQNGIVEYQPNDEYHDDKDLNLYAIWKLNNFMIYNKGTQNIPLTLTGTSGYYSWNSSSITLNKAVSKTGYSTYLYSTNKIDVTKYKKLYVKGDFYIVYGNGNSSNFEFGLATTKNTSDGEYYGNYWFRNAISTQTNVNNATFYVDISSLSGSYYLKMKSYNSSITITQIWLSPV